MTCMHVDTGACFYISVSQQPCIYTVHPTAWTMQGSRCLPAQQSRPVLCSTFRSQHTGTAHWPAAQHLHAYATPALAWHATSLLYSGAPASKL